MRLTFVFCGFEHNISGPGETKEILKGDSCLCLDTAGFSFTRLWLLAAVSTKERPKSSSGRSILTILHRFVTIFRDNKNCGNCTTHQDSMETQAEIAWVEPEPEGLRNGTSPIKRGLGGSN